MAIPDIGAAYMTIDESFLPPHENTNCYRKKFFKEFSVGFIQRCFSE